MKPKYTTEAMRFDFGKNPDYFLEHAFRHLEVLIGEYNADKINNQQFHETRGIIKKQYLAIQQAALLDEVEKRVNKLKLFDPKPENVSYNFAIDHITTTLEAIRKEII